jgi:acetylornithine deacetylase
MLGGSNVPTEIGAAELANAVAAEEGAMEELLGRLVAAPTTLGNEELGQAVMREAYREAGLEPRDLPLDPEAIRASPFSSPFSWDVSGKTNVVADLAPAGDGGRSLVLNGHVDVVGPAAERLWRTAPFEAVRDGDWVYGRGAGDMKAGLVAIVGAVRALRRLGLAPLAPVQVQSVVEEECTGNGALQCVLSGWRPDAALVTEPYPATITVAQIGVLWFHVDIAGAPVHVADAGEGVNAIEAAFPIVAALHRLEAELNEAPPPPYDVVKHPINLNVGVIAGGDWPSTVAAECTLSCRVALYPGMRVADLQARVEETVAAAAAAHPYLARHPPVVRYEGFACEGVTVPSDAPLVLSLAAAHEEALGAAPSTIATTATTDVRAFVQHGIPAVCLGPHAEAIHGVDERVLWPSVVQTAQVLAVFIRDWCGLAPLVGPHG